MSRSEPSSQFESSSNGIRSSIRIKRRAVSAEDRATASAKICQSIQSMKSFQNANKIAGFLAFDGEADPLKLMTWAVDNQKQVFVPVIVGKQEPLMFAPWTPEVKLKTNRFGIAEPHVPAETWIQSRELDFVITPLVAFDERCHRIGVGGGYYDRSFTFLNSSDSDEERRPIMIGFAFELQRVDQVTPSSWDVPLTAIVTERQIYYRREANE